MNKTPIELTVESFVFGNRTRKGTDPATVYEVGQINGRKFRYLLFPDDLDKRFDPEEAPTLLILDRVVFGIKVDGKTYFSTYPDYRIATLRGTMIGGGFVLGFVTFVSMVMFQYLPVFGWLLLMIAVTGYFGAGYYPHFFYRLMKAAKAAMDEMQSSENHSA